MRKLLVVGVVVAFLVHFAPCMVHVEIVSILPYDFNVATAIVWTGAAFQLAVEAANEKYKPFLNVTLHLIYNTSHRTCDDIASDSIQMLSEYYYRYTDRESVYGLVESPCTDAIGTQSIATAWDWLLFANGVAQDDFLNNDITPTAMAVGGTFRGYAVILMKLFMFYRWSHVTILLQAKTVTSFYGALASTLMDRTKPGNMYDYTFNMDLYKFDPTNQSMADALYYARKRSRVLVILAPGTTALQLLLGTETLGMANGEYVFINVQPLQQDIYGKAVLFSNPKTNNLKAFQSFLYIAYRSTGAELAKLNHKIVERTKTLFNRTYENGSEPLDSYAVQASYDIVDILTATVNETAPFKDPRTVWSGQDLAARMSNRTFTGLTTGDIYIGPESARFLDLVIFGFSPHLRVMQALGRWSWAGRQLSWNNLTIDWPTHDGKPPVDMPLCGYSGFSNDCVLTGNMLISILLPVLVGISLVAAGLLLFLKHGYKAVNRGWLILPPDLSTRRGSDNTSWAAGNANWKGKRVWTKIIHLKQMPTPEGLTFLDLLIQPSYSVQHPNINTLFGICLYDNRAVLVTNYCKHGSLFELFYEMNLDCDFKHSLLTDLIEGLHFIHTILDTFHGHLQAKHCLVDERFTLRIAELDFHPIIRYLTKVEVRSAHHLWTPPEILNGRAVLSKESDIFMLGLLVVTVATQEEPRRVQNPVGCLVEVPPGLPFELTRMVEQCASDDPKARPPIQTVRRWFSQMDAPGSVKGHNIIDRVLARYSTYTATLENAVRERSEELKRERARCDEILQQMLPAFVVEKLRSSRALPAEFFDTATIYFSDLVGFVSWVSLVSPYTVMKVLNFIYTIFDGEIAHYTVQKIETVGDSYMVASGIPHKNDAHAAEICRMAIGLMKIFKENGNFPSGFLLRVGIHSGSCAAGVIGTKVPRYCLFGDAVNIASRMETHGQGSRIHISSTTAALIVQYAAEFVCTERGIIPIKGKGEMRTYWLS